MRLRRWLPCVLAWLVVPAPDLAAQLAPIGVPRGLVRLDLRVSFDDASRRFRDGSTEDYGADFASPALGSDRIASLRAAEARIAQVLGRPEYRLDLGRATANGHATVSSIEVGLAYGLTSRLTIFGSVPIVRARAELALGLDPAGANAGLNPADPALGTAAGRDQAAQFFEQFDAALATLGAKLAAGDYDADPSLRALAQHTLASGTALRDGLRAIVQEPATASPFLPTQGSEEGIQLAAGLAALQATLGGPLGVPNFTAGAPLPSAPLTRDELERFLTAPSGPIGGRPLEARTIFLAGDTDVGASYTWLDRWDPTGRRRGIRSVLEARVRLPTGYLDLPDHFFDLGSGERQLDVGLRLVTDVAAGRWGARLSAGFTRQFASTRLRRVGRPDQPFTPAARLTNLRRDPGDVIAIGLQPYLRIAPGLGLHLAGSYWRKGTDRYTYATAADSIPGVSAAEMEVGTEAGTMVVGGGVSYTSPGRLAPNGRGLPIEARWTYETTVHGTGERTPLFRGTRAELRIYHRLFR
ncbi:MAG TPA: hypothetical protein VNK43_05750 [Gemmatimonadales bacterium]|nr:hypothetical protein [Gemmatimonadales bacterium]